MLGFALSVGCKDKPATETTTAPRVAPSAVLLLGDSLTAGSRAHPGFRVRLAEALLAEHPSLKFVGSEAGFPDDHEVSLGDSALRHEGHWGWRADESLAMLPRWLQQYRADVALVMLGTNDCFQGQAPEATLQELRDIGRALRRANPRLSLVYSRLIPAKVGSPAVGPCLTLVNTGLPALVRDLDSAAAHAWLADPTVDFDASRDTYDGVHPNDNGGAKMARALETVLQRVLDAQGHPAP